MGREKPLQTVGGVPLVERAAAAVRTCVDEMLLVTNRPELYEFLDMPIVEDVVVGRGPLGGLLAAHRKLGATRALVVASDYPFLEEEALRRILREDPAGGVVLPQIDGHPHPLCALYAPDALAAAHDALARGELMLMSLVSRLPQIFIPQSELGGPAASRIFFNVNTPADLERAEELLAASQPRHR
jgi:molybdopterin-guanine dinucleotide biosynthesis protein A